ncbi:MAG: hypothetical protein ACRC6R_07355, partial [Bacteroidales bacterium]
MKSSHDAVVGKVSTAEGKIRTLEASSTSANNKIAVLETKSQDGTHLETSLAAKNLHALGKDHKDRVTNLHDIVKPSNSGKFLKINPSGSLVECSDVNIDTTAIETRVGLVEDDIVKHDVRISSLELGGGGGGGSSSALLDLLDTPTSYSNMRGKLLAVDDNEQGVEFISVVSGSPPGYDNFTNKVFNLEASDLTQNNRLEALEDKLDVDLEPLETLTAAHETSIRSHGNRLNAIESGDLSTIGSIRTRVTASEGKIADNRVSIVDIERNATALGTAIAAVETKADLVKTDLGSTDGRVSVLSASLDIVKNVNTSQDADIRDHEARIENLELGGGVGGGSVDLSPILARLQDVEANDLLQDVKVNGALKHLPSAVLDCNTLISAGSYGVAGNSENWCFGTVAGVIAVHPHNTTYLTQTAYCAADNKTRMRTCNKGVWTSWVKIYSEYEKPTASEVQAVNLNYGVGAAGKDIASMNSPEIKGGAFNSGGASAGAYSNYSPFLQAARAGGSDGTGQLLQIQANHNSKKMAFRTRDKNEWNTWESVYSPSNKPSPLEIGAVTAEEFDGDLNSVKDPGMYRISSNYTNGPEDELGGSKPTYSQMLNVKAAGDTAWQMIGDFRGKNLWWRGFNDSFANGGDWHRVYHSGNKPTLPELGAPMETGNKYDVRNFGVTCDGVTDDTDAFIRACNTVYGYNGTLTAPGNGIIKLSGVNKTVTVRCNMNLNNATIDISDFKGMISFARTQPETVCGPDHPLVKALQVEDKLTGSSFKGWANIPEVEDCYFMMNTEEPLFSYRGSVKNRVEFNKVGRYGLLESQIR